MKKMYEALIITPVKNSIENALQTIQAVAQSDLSVLHYVYDDFSEENCTAILRHNQAQYGYKLIHLSSLTSSPSPNYKYVLQDAQKEALALNIPLIIVESDVEVQVDTFSRLLKYQEAQMGLVGAVTVGYDAHINFPYLKFKDKQRVPQITTRSLSFCCTLVNLSFLKAYNFQELDTSKDWYDTIISNEAIQLGFTNYILLDVPVLHKPHGSRPWKQLKYTNPLKYYWLKFIKGRDKI